MITTGGGPVCSPGSQSQPKHRVPWLENHLSRFSYDKALPSFIGAAKTSPNPKNAEMQSPAPNAKLFTHAIGTSFFYLVAFNKILFHTFPLRIFFVIILFIVHRAGRTNKVRNSSS
jgi:hypothetical protein